jgi:hypothetical protein
MKNKSKTWIIKIEAEIRNYGYDEDDEIEDKSHIKSLIRQGLDIDNTFSGTLGCFKTDIKTLDVKLKSRNRR